MKSDMQGSDGASYVNVAVMQRDAGGAQITPSAPVVWGVLGDLFT